MMNFLKPDKTITHCPVCGAPMHYTELNQFDLPVGYHMECTDCGKYNDIWVSGLRVVSCGGYTTPDYMSNYAAMTKPEKITEAVTTVKLNLALLYEKARLTIARRQHSTKGDRHVTA